MSNIERLAALVGKRVRIDAERTRLEGLTIKGEIVDARHIFGRDEVLIRPRSIEGERWAQLDSVEIEDN